MGKVKMKIDDIITYRNQNMKIINIIGDDVYLQSPNNDITIVFAFDLVETPFKVGDMVNVLTMNVNGQIVNITNVTIDPITQPFYYQDFVFYEIQVDHNEEKWLACLVNEILALPIS